MKPIYLDINYFGPHQHSVIDFRKLDESPIFLIGGDTGAGKSTIFDAMTYALFNTTTRSDRDAKEMRSQFATEKDTTKVIFYFEQNGKIYKVDRTPEQYLAKKVGTGNTKKKPTAHLAVVDDVGTVESESIASKPVDVGHAIHEILNLGAEQFKKIILLPQNDFSQFLKSDTADKEEILKKIFGTQLFTDFTVKLKEHYKQANNKATDFTNELKSQIESPVWTEDEQNNLQQLPNDQLTAALSEYLNNRQSLLTNAKAVQEKTSSVRKKAEENYHSAQNIQNNFDDLARLKKEYQTNVSDQKNTIDDKQKHVMELTWAKPLQEIVRDLDKTKADLKDTKNNRVKISEQLDSAQEKLKQAKAEIDTLNNRTNEFETKKQQAQELTVLITKVQDIERIKHEIDSLNPQLIEVENTANQKSQDLNNFKEKIATKNEELKKFDGLSEAKDKLITAQTNFTETFSPLENERNNSAAEVAKLQKKLGELHNDLDNKSNALEKAKKDYQEKIKTRQSLMIAQLRQELKSGEPCAVCGSTDHPYAKNTAVADEKELRKSMDAVDDSQKTFAAIDNSVKNIQQNIKDASDEFDEKQKSAVSAQMNLSNKYTKAIADSKIELPESFDLAEVKTVFQNKIKEINQKITESQELTQEIKHLEKEQENAQTAFTDANSKFEKLNSAIETRSNDLKQRLQNIGDTKSSSQDLTNKKDKLNKDYEDFQNELKSTQEIVNKNNVIYSNTQTKLTDNQERLDKETTNIKTLTEKLDESLNSDTAKTNDLTILEQWIKELNQDELANLREAISSYQKEKEMLTENIQKIAKKLENVKKPELDKLEQALNKAQAEYEAAIKQAENASRDFADAETCFKKVKTIMQKQGDFAKKLAAITSLYNVVNGRDGNDNKLKLETYVVQNYLQKILAYANATFLNRLSHNRYSFVISDKAVDHQKDHGLDINVYDRETDATRSSDTLSGGETFIAALSIALSLSEVVQSSANGVQIDALFVDEGFGSLDEETLDEAMAALEDIGKNRMVGVISHIESMKQSIGQQLLVKKLGDGKSKIELINK